MKTLLVDATQLVSFSLERVHRNRRRELFLGPLLLVHEAPPARTNRIRTAVADGDVLFNQSYHGYSARGHPQGKLLVRYLALLLGSRPALWYSLITSGRFGFERDVVEKLTIDRIPVPPFETLHQSDRRQVEILFEDLVQHANEEAWARVDSWVASLYGLRNRDLQVITDTLVFNLPFSRSRKAAQAPPAAPELTAFRSTLSSELKPWAQRAGKQIHVLPVRLPTVSPWGVVQVGTAPTSAKPATNQDWPEIVRLADQLAATEIIHPDSAAGCLWLARLNQARYWSRSQARLVARRIAWEYVDFLSGLKGK